MRNALDSLRGHRTLLRIGAAVVVIAVMAAGGVALASSERTASKTPGTATASSSAPAAPLPATRVLAMPRSHLSDGSATLTVTLSGAAAAGSPQPTLTPAVAGTWSAAGDSLVFTPSSTLQPCATYTLTVWANTTAADASRVGHRHVESLHVACPPIAGLQQALARLGYLGAKLHPLYDVALPAGAESRREAAAHAYHPPRGALAPDPANAPPVHMGTLEAVTRGALEIYQSERGLEASGEPNTATWNSLLSEVSSDRRNPHPYTWVSVTETLPETLEVHRGRHVVFTTPANTGVPGAETEQGVFPIYARYITTTMTGTDVDGTKYDVPDVPWVNYFNGGDAVHGYPRASYGFPQSNGCVELPIEAAHTVFGMLQLGDIVWVQ